MSCIKAIHDLSVTVKISIKERNSVQTSFCTFSPPTGLVCSPCRLKQQYSRSCFQEVRWSIPCLLLVTSPSFLISYSTLFLPILIPHLSILSLVLLLVSLKHCLYVLMYKRCMGGSTSAHYTDSLG